MWPFRARMSTKTSRSSLYHVKVPRSGTRGRRLTVIRQAGQNRIAKFECGKISWYAEEGGQHSIRFLARGPHKEPICA